MFRSFVDLGRVHFVGIGGTGMSGIAEVLLDYELEVSGSDLARSEATDRLEGAGAKVFLGHHAEHVHGADLVVKSSAVPDTNPEIAEARRLGITVVRRAEMLAELMRLKYGIAIAGTHGKTTTTSLIGTLLTEAGRDPSVIVGGRLRASGTGARVGHSPYLVAEADEFDRSFLRLAPILAVITSIDVDHLDTYTDLAAIADAFVEFASRVPFFGQVIVCLDDANVQAILPRLADRRVVSYGFSPQADLVAFDLEPTERGTLFSIRHRERGLLGRIEVPLPGRHNVANTLAAVAVGLAVGLDFEAIVAGVAAFRGVHRRFERLGTWRGAAVVDDYAHHPTEVAATLEAARQAYHGRRLIAVFQPHLYSRTRQQADGFGRALLGAEIAVVTGIYGSREAPEPGVSAELVVEAARGAGHRDVVLCPRWSDVPELLAGRIAPNDVILTMGAGDIVRLAEALVAQEQG